MSSKLTRVRLTLDVLVPTGEAANVLNSASSCSGLFPDYSVRVSSTDSSDLTDAEAIIECAEHGSEIGFFGFSVNAESVDCAVEFAIDSGAPTELLGAPKSKQIQFLAAHGLGPDDLLVEA